MSFAKAAAEALTNEDAIAEREERQNRWKKWLATAAGLAALGAGAYYGYKNWPGAPKTMVEKLTGDSGATTGAIGGVLGGELAPPIRGGKLPWHHSAAGTTMTGIRDASANPKDTELSKYVGDLNKSLPDAGKGQTLHSELNAAMSPNAGKEHPFSQAADFGREGGVRPLAGGPDENPLQKALNFWRSSKDQGNLISNLRTIHSLAGEPGVAPTEPVSSAPGAPAELPLPTPPSSFGKAPAAASSGDPARAALAKTIQANLHARTGMNATQWADHLSQMGRLKGTPRGMVGRGLINGMVGGAVGGGVDWLGNKLGLGEQ